MNIDVVGLDPRIPDLAGFTVCYGVPVSSIGEDGDLVALGHYPPHRALAAFNRYSRTVIGLKDITDGGYVSDMTALLKAMEPKWAVQRQHCATFPQCGSVGPVADGFPCHDDEGTGYPDHAWDEWSEPWRPSTSSPLTGLRRRSCDNCDARELLHPDGRVEQRDNPCDDCVEIDDCSWYLEWAAEPNCPGAFPIMLWRA